MSQAAALVRWIMNCSSGLNKVDFERFFISTLLGNKICLSNIFESIRLLSVITFPFCVF